MKRARFAAFAALLASAAAYADPSVTARVSANETSLGNSIQLSVDVTGANDIGSEPNINLPDFQVQRAGETRSFQWINGRSSSMISFNYVLSPTKTGTLRVPSISVTADGKTMSTEPLLVVVHSDTPRGGAGTGPSASSGGGRRGTVNVPAESLRPLFMTAVVDSDKVYVGQQVLLRVQLVRRPDIQFASQARYTEPDLTGFLVEPLKQQVYTTTIDGAQYEVTELPYALFPTSDGSFAIGSAGVEVAVRAQIDPYDPNSFFQNFFSRSQIARLNTRAIPVSVRALPKDKPANFSGAVGRFKMTAKLDSTDLEVGKPVNLILTVTGVGNIKALKEPFLPDLHGFRRYETISSANEDTTGRFLHGSKEFKILLMPQASGNLTIPAATFSYFDPAQNDYVVETTPEIPVTVKPGTLSANAEQNLPAAAPAGAPTEGIRVMERDVRFIKTGPVKPVTRPLYEREWFLLVNLLPPLFAFSALLVRRGRERRLYHAGEYRARSAARNARRRLAAAKKALGAPQPAAFYEPVQSAVAGYIADKLGVSAAGLTRDAVDRALADKGVGAETRAAVHDLMDRADAARFAPSSLENDDRGAALAQADDAIRAMEKVL